MLPPDENCSEGIQGVWKPNGQLAKFEAFKNNLKIVLKPGLHYTVPETLEVSQIETITFGFKSTVSFVF